MKKYLKYLLISIGSLVGLLFLAAVVITLFFGKQVNGFFIKELNKNLATEVKISGGMKLSILKNFPNASVTFYQVEIRESLPESQDNAIEAEEISLIFNIWNLIRGKYEVKKIEIQNANINLVVTKDGTINYKFWKDSESSEPSDNDFNLKLNKARLINVNVRYADETLPQHYEAFIHEGTLSGEFSDTRYTMFTDLKMLTREISVKGVKYLPNNEISLTINLDIDTDAEIYKFESGKLVIEGDDYDIDGMIHQKQRSTEMDISINGKDISLQSLVTFLPDEYTKALKHFDSKGTLFFNASVKGTSSDKSNPNINVSFGLEKGKIVHREMKKDLEKVNFNGSFTNGSRNSLATTVLDIPTFTAIFDGEPIDFRLKMSNFEDPVVDLKLNANLDLKMFGPAFEDENLRDIRGRINFENLAVNGNFRDMRHGRMRNVISTGKITMEAIDFTYLEKSFRGLEGILLLDYNNLDLQNINLEIDRSDFNLNGKITNILTFIATNFEGNGNAVMDIDAEVKSTNLDLYTLSQYKYAETDEKQSSAGERNYLRPFRMFRGNLTAEVESFKFQNFEAKRIIAQAALSPEVINIHKLNGATVDGYVQISGSLKVDGDQFLISENKATLRNIDIKKLFLAFDNFDQSVLTADNLKGELASTVNFTMVWDKTFDFLSDRFYMVADLTIKDGELMRFEPLKDLSAYVKVSELEHIKFLELKNEIVIKDGKITIPAMSIHSTAMNMLMAGTHTFNNEIDYQFRINLMDVLSRKVKFSKTRLSDIEETDGGLINMYVAMTGTVDDPVFSVDRKMVKAKLYENNQQMNKGFMEVLKEDFLEDKPKRKLDWKTDEEDDLEFIDWGDSTTTLEAENK